MSVADDEAKTSSELSNYHILAVNCDAAANGDFHNLCGRVFETLILPIKKGPNKLNASVSISAIPNKQKNRNCHNKKLCNLIGPK